MSQQTSALDELFGLGIIIAFIVVFGYGVYGAFNAAKTFVMGDSFDGYRVTAYNGTTHEWTVERIHNVHRSGEFFPHTNHTRMNIVCSSARWRWTKDGQGVEDGWIPTFCDLKVASRYPLSLVNNDIGDRLEFRESLRSTGNGPFESEQRFVILKNDLVDE